MNQVGGAAHDVTAEAGFFALLDLALRLAPGGLIMGGPPCSLFVFLSSSVHRRGVGHELGDASRVQVRLANLVVENTMVLLEVVSPRGVWFVLEQPAGSWMFKLPRVQETFARLGCQPVRREPQGCQPGGSQSGGRQPADRERGSQQDPVQRICTWMGAFGHEMPKGSHLVGTLPTLPLLRRDRPPALSPGETRAALWRRTPTGVQGGRELPGSAAYTPDFCEALYSAWLRAASPVGASTAAASRGPRSSG